MTKNNYPQSGLDDVPPAQVREIVSSLLELHNLGKPQSDEETEERINAYFEFCERSSIRPGIESLCLSLHISRTTLFRWNNGQDCSERRKELIQTAKSFIAACLEQYFLSGKINPATGIFLAKNWMGYRDTISLEESVPQSSVRQAMNASELPKLGLGLHNNGDKCEE